MSIYIKGMEMPTSCWDCYFQDCGNCRLNAHKVVDKCIIEDRVDNDCPLISVPEHGRLIDANAMTASVKTQTEFTKLLGSEIAEVAGIIEENFLNEINAAPTIIPADEEEQP